MGFCGYLRQSTEVDILLGPFIDDTTGKDAETGLTIDVELSKNGQALADSESAAPTHDSAGDVNGYYNCVLGTTDTNTLGILAVVAHAAGFLPVHQTYQIVVANWYDSMCSTDVLQSDLTQIGGVVQSATDLKDFADTGYTPGTHSVALVDACTTNTDMRGTDDAALASVLGAAVGASISADIAAIKAETALIVADTNELQTDDTPAALAAIDAKIDTIDGIVDDILVDTGTTLNNLITAVGTVVDGIQTDLDNGTDGLGALKALIDALNDLSAAEVNAEVVDALNVDTYAEPGQGVPGATISLIAKVGYLYKAWRNKVMQDATTYELYNDAGNVVDQKATVSDDGTDFTKGEVGSGA